MKAANSNETAAMTVFEGDLRVSASGTKLGRRVSFVQNVPAGDVRKALKARGFTGKRLTEEVDKVLRGDCTLGKAMLFATVHRALDQGFTPTVGDLNKAGTKLTLKLERPSTVIDKVAVAQVIEREYSDAELEAILAARKAKREEQAATEVESEVQS